MKKKYDVIIVGAGPAGLMAARTAAERNLTVALIEKRTDITRWTRADCMQFYGFEGDFLGEDIRVEIGRIIFPRNGFEVRYTGGLYPIYSWRCFSPKGHRIDFSSRHPIAALFDKEALLRDLLGEVEKTGAALFPGTLALKAENLKEGARVLVLDKGQERWLEARKVIAADGINSRITESIGLNRERTFMGRFNVVQYLLEGVQNPYLNSWMQFYGKSISPFAPPHFLPTVQGERLQKLGAIRPAPGNPEDDLKNFMERGYYAAWFKKAKIVSKMGISVKAFLPLARPVMGNVLAVGDAPAFAEVENQGALMCGYHAGGAMLKELKGENGIEEYIDWWQQSFEFLNPEIHRIAQGYAINPYYEDEEIDYLFSLIEGEVLEGTVNQYKIPRRLWDAIFRHRERIQEERPDLFKKIESVQQMTLQEAFTIEGGKT
ncbi:MAG TPA: NAD(P)/FAD-dependent oxidoreductase [Thermodesulfobacteriota bacterium]|nr:NAD(P)/FAD-dependent oxidoreductase [Thermodesulfobacteriota bacterium]